MSDTDFNARFSEASHNLYDAHQKMNALLIEQYKTDDMLDADGYPTNATLQIIELWPPDDKKGWFDLIKSFWWNPEFGWSEGEEDHEWKIGKVYRYHLSTGGWSGNESIIEAMQNNKNYLWVFTWVQSRRGGHYIFERHLNNE